jgi:hypothetical protein
MWFSLIWPIIGIGGALCISCLRCRLVWWEVIVPFLPILIFVPMGKTMGVWWQTTDTERWGGHAIRACYYEDWNERVSCRHARYKTVTKQDSNGNTYTEEVFDGYEHSYDVDYHPPYWELETTLSSRYISEQQYQRFVQRWTNGRPEFHELNRSYHTNDGDLWFARWGGDVETMEPVFEERRYENRTQAPNTLYRFDPIDPKKTPVHSYPKLDEWRANNVLGPLALPELQRRLALLNAVMGPQHQCHVWICTWRNAPEQVAMDQVHHWKGGNKNELVACISVDDVGAPQWAHVFSWMDDQTFSFELRDFLLSQEKTDLVAFIDELRKEIPTKWKRKRFSKKAPDGGFAFIDVQPPTWMYWLVHILSIGATGVSLFYLLNNESVQEELPSWMKSTWRFGKN